MVPVDTGNLTIGTPDCDGTGTVTVSGDTLFVTNAAHNATLEIRSGTFTLNGGMAAVDTLVVTNVCGHFVRTGGTLIYGSAVLTTNLDADGDGIPNGYEQSYGLDPLNAADANVDSDGDGQSNLAEYLAGTDPTNSTSSFGITGVVLEGADIRVTWAIAPDKTNALQSGDAPMGSFANIFTVTNTVGLVTNDLDAGATTNFPSRF